MVTVFRDRYNFLLRTTAISFEEVEDDWALSAFTLRSSEQWTDFPTGQAVVRLQLCHRALLECPAVKSWQLPSPAPGWHHTAEPQTQFSPTSTSCTSEESPPFAPVGCLPMWAQPQLRPSQSLAGMQHNDSKGWPLKQNIFLLFKKLPEMLNCFIVCFF